MPKSGTIVSAVRTASVSRRKSLISPGFEEGAGPTDAPSGSTSRYFFIAIVGLTLHAGSIYFYLWGATVREAGLTGMVVMLGFGMCLIVGVFYSWARGAVTHAIESEAETRTD